MILPVYEFRRHIKNKTTETNPSNKLFLDFSGFWKDKISDLNIWLEYSNILKLKIPIRNIHEKSLKYLHKI